MTQKVIIIDDKIKEIKRLAYEIMEAGSEIEAVKKNTKRILASVFMLELNISDARDLL